jgi:hypothetical protein
MEFPDYRDDEDKNRKDIFGNVVVFGFIISVVAALASMIPGLGFLFWLTPLGIIPFAITTILAFAFKIISLFYRK